MIAAPHPRTLTHAELRRSQGDRRAAEAILEAMIADGIDVDGARQALQRLRGNADPRIARLERWLQRVRRAR